MLGTAFFLGYLGLTTDRKVWCLLLCLRIMLAHINKLAWNSDKWPYLTKKVMDLVKMSDVYKSSTNVEGMQDIADQWEKEEEAKKKAKQPERAKKTAKQTERGTKSKASSAVFSRGDDSAENESQHEVYDEAEEGEEEGMGEDAQDSLDEALHREIDGDVAPLTPTKTSAECVDLGADPSQESNVKVVCNCLKCRQRALDGMSFDVSDVEQTQSSRRRLRRKTSATRDSSEVARKAPTAPAGRGGQKPRGVLNIAGKAKGKPKEKAGAKKEAKAAKVPQFMKQGADPSKSDDMEPTLHPPFAMEERKPAKSRKGEWYLIQASTAEDKRYTTVIYHGVHLNGSTITTKLNATDSCELVSLRTFERVDLVHACKCVCM